MDRTGLQDGDVVAIHRTKAPESVQVVVARFGDEVTLKRYVRFDERQVELRPESRNPKQEVMKLDLAKHKLEIDGVAVGGMLTRMRGQDPRLVETRRHEQHFPADREQEIAGSERPGEQVRVPTRFVLKYTLTVSREISRACQ